MIEAVNSALANATLLRGNTEQANPLQSNSPAGNLAELDKPQSQLAPYLSLFISVDNDFDKAVLQIRDSDTGDVQNQFPSETTLRARAAQAEIESQSIRQVNQQINSSSAGTTQQSSAPAPQTTSFAPRVAEAQIASATFSAQALSGSQGQASVSVVA